MFIHSAGENTLNPAHVRWSVIVAFKIFPPGGQASEKKSPYLLQTIDHTFLQKVKFTFCGIRTDLPLINLLLPIPFTLGSE